MQHQHYTNFPDIAQEEFRGNIEQKDKIVRNNVMVTLLIGYYWLVIKWHMTD